MAKVTVAMPVYNDAAYLGAAIESILNQSFKDFTLLIVNDGSTDDCQNIISSYADKRIKVIHHPKNMGRAAARNTALDAADSKYFAWMDADDISLQNRLQMQYDFMEKNKNISICGTQIIRFNESHEKRSYEMSPEAVAGETLFRPGICNAAAFMRLQDIRFANLKYDIDFKRAQDFVFWIEAIFIKGLRVANLSQTGYLYRVFKRSATQEWHFRAVKEYLMPALSLKCTDDEIDIHTKLVTEDRRQMINKYSPNSIFAWIDKFYIYLNRKKAYYTMNGILRLFREAERTIAYSTFPLESLCSYKKHAIAAKHPAYFLYGRTFSRYIKSKIYI